jgi:methyltransferase family protein
MEPAKSPGNSPGRSSGGYLARKLAAAAGPAGHVTGVEPSAAIVYARRRALLTMTVTVGVAQDLDLPDSSFDVVTCTLALHHVPARKRGAAFVTHDTPGRAAGCAPGVPVWPARLVARCQRRQVDHLCWLGCAACA